MVSKPIERQLYSDDEFEAFLKLPENSDRLFERIDGRDVLPGFKLDVKKIFSKASFK